MQYIKNKYIIKCLFIVVALQLLFKAPDASANRVYVKTEENNTYDDNSNISLSELSFGTVYNNSEDAVDDKKRNNKQIHQSRRAERRAARQLLKKTKAEDKAKIKAYKKAEKLAEKEARRESKGLKAKKNAEKKDKPSTEENKSNNNLNKQPNAKTGAGVDSSKNKIGNIDTINVSKNIDETFLVDTTLNNNVIQKIDSSINNSIPKDSSATDSIKPKKRKPFIEEIIHTTSADSMVYNVKDNLMYLYKDANVNYEKNALKSYYVKMFLNKNEIFAKGALDTANVYTKVNFQDGNSSYNMDSITYNLRSQKSIVKGIAFKEGEGIIHGEKVKMMNTKTLNLRHARYTTCDDTLCPHFYLASTKAQVVQGKNSKNIIVGPSYLVIEGVPLPLGVPYGFFPLMTDRSSGVIIPEFGEESQKGFFLRGGGYYFAFNDYLDLSVRGGIYTLGSWELNGVSNYRKRYQYSGNVNVSYSKDIIGEKGMADYLNSNNYRIEWSHTQDPKFMPNSTFSASVNYSSSSFNKYNGTIEDYITAQTSSSISYSKSWAGKPMSLSLNLRHSQNNRDSTVSLGIPDVLFSVSKIYPFKRKLAIGKQRWYEKIGMSYTGTFNNSVTTKQNMLFKKEMFDQMKYGFNHTIPINASFTALKYLNITPGVNYKERWYFNRIEKSWDPKTQSVVTSDTTSGFYRVYDYSASFSLQTMIYGMYTFKGDRAIKAIRHVMTPSVSFSYSPDFSQLKYGFYKPIQTSADGTIGTYSPYEQGIYGVPGRGQNGSISFSLANTLEMKVRSKNDTTGYKKVKIFESLNASTSYNLLADSMNLSPVSLSARTTLFKSLGINLSATWDPYKYNNLGIRTKNYGAGRITNSSLSFGYSFRSVFGYEGEGSGTGSETLPRNLTPEEHRDALNSGVNPNAAVSLLLPEYYNFSIPWNLSLNYIMSYSHSGLKKNITQTLSYNGSITITQKWGLSFSGGLNLQNFKFTPGDISIDRDLHCWQMGFTWVPVGFRKSWSFNIKVKSSVLQDLKFKKTSGYLDNLY